MFSRSLILAIGIVALAATAANADYLQVTRPATLKGKAAGDAEVIETLPQGTFLELQADGQQTEGYYRALDPTSGSTGWVYRTLVRRYRGQVPGVGTASNGVPSSPNSSASQNTAKVHFIDVGQGNSALLEFSCGVDLIDVGGQDAGTDEALIRYLDDFFNSRPDLNRTINTIFITHTHIDHNRALEKVVESFTVKNYVFNGHLTSSGKVAAKWMVDHGNDDGRQIAEEVVGETDVDHAIGNGGLTDDKIDAVNCSGTDPVLHIMSSAYDTNPGWPDGSFENENNSSLVIRLDFGKASFLFTGDLEDDAIETMVEKYDGTHFLDTDVYEVGHHGSANGTTESLLEAVTPKIAVISCGHREVHKAWTAWAYGHPRGNIVLMLDRVTERLPGGGTRQEYVATAVKKFEQVTLHGAVYATGWDGTVVVTASSDGGLTVGAAGPTN